MKRIPRAWPAHSALRPAVTSLEVNGWCEEVLGAGVARDLFESGYSSAVIAVELVDGRRVVIKARPWADRLIGCTEVQRRIFESGFRCPEPLAGPILVGGLALSFEALVQGDEVRTGDDAAEALALVLADLTDRAPAPEEVPPLPAPYGFLRWPHADEPLWPRTPEISIDLNDRVFDDPWLDELAKQVAGRLDVELPAVIGHGDWWAQNIRWQRGALAAVDDWDSVVTLPEAAIAGCAAALFNMGESTVRQTELFLAAYADARCTLADEATWELAWAAGLWARLVDAKKLLAMGHPGSAERLRGEAAERTGRAGLEG